MTTTSTDATLMNKRIPKSIILPKNVDMQRVAVVILSGGRGTRLFPLTETRCKPAVSFAGKYRVIDVPISNAIRSKCDKIYIITQFLSTSLHKHICSTYHGTSTFNKGFLDLLSAEQRPSNQGWYQGTADAIRQNLYYLSEAPVDYFLVLSGDQLYDMNFTNLVACALNTDADVVISTLPVNAQDASRMGIMKIDAKGQIKDFIEKPQQKELLDTFKLSANTRNRLALDTKDQRKYLGSMGIYLFKRQALFDLLKSDPREDFGKHLLPTQIGKGNTYAYIHDGYWEDIGTIRSYYDANISLTYPDAPYNTYNENLPLIAGVNKLPAAKIINTLVNHSIICEGSIIEADEIVHSILGPRSIVKKGTVIRNSYVMGNDFYTPPVSERFPAKLQISEDCFIQNAIIDKDVFIGKGVKLINKSNLSHYDGGNIFIRDNIIIVARGASLPDGFTL